MDFIKKNIALLLGLSIPVVMIIAVASTIYLPSLFFKPRVNFIFATGYDTYNCPAFSVADSHIVVNPAIQTACKNIPINPVLYVYDVATNKATAISTTTATTLQIDSSATSPDGFSISDGRTSSLPDLFWGGNYSDYRNIYLVGHGYSTRLNITPQDNYYYYQFYFLGWIKA